MGPSILGGFVAFIAGSAIASATVFGVVSSQTGAPAQSPTQVGQAQIDPANYGSTD